MTCNPGTSRSVRTTCVPTRPSRTTAAAAALLLIAGCGTGGPSQPASPSPSAAPSRPAAEIDWTKQPSAKVSVTIDLDKLKRGPDPKVPWYADGAIHDGSQVTPIKDGLKERSYESVLFHAADGAYGVSVNQSDHGDSWSALIDREGNVLAKADVEAVSADGSLVAWIEPTPRKTRDGVPVVRDLRTGKTTRGNKRPIAGVDGFVGSKVLYGTYMRGGYVEGLAMWDPATDSDETVSPDAADATFVTDDVMIAGIRMEGDRGWCKGLFSFKQRKPLRKQCDSRLLSAVRHSPYLVWTARQRSVLVDARNGQGVMRLSSKGEHIDYMSGEPGGAILVKMSGSTQSDIEGDDGRTAIVRCTLQGRCELASKIYEGKPREEKTLIGLSQ